MCLCMCVYGHVCVTHKCVYIYIIHIKIKMKGLAFKELTWNCGGLGCSKSDLVSMLPGDSGRRVAIHVKRPSPGRIADF